MRALPDGAGLIPGGDVKGEPAAIGFQQDGFHRHGHPQRGGGGVDDIQGGAHGADPLLETGLHEMHTDRLHQRGQAGGGEHAGGAAAHPASQLFLGDRAAFRAGHAHQGFFFHIEGLLSVLLAFFENRGILMTISDVRRDAS